MVLKENKKRRITACRGPFAGNGEGGRGRQIAFFWVDDVGAAADMVCGRGG